MLLQDMQRIMVKIRCKGMIICDFVLNYSKNDYKDSIKNRKHFQAQM